MTSNVCAGISYSAPCPVGAWVGTHYQQWQYCCFFWSTWLTCTGKLL